MQQAILVVALAVMAHGAQAQVAETPRVQSSYLGLGLTKLSGYYTRANESAEGIAFAPTLVGSLGMSRAVALRGGVAYQRNRIDRDERYLNQRFVRQQTTANVVVPVLLELTLNPGAPRFHMALVGGFSFWHINQQGHETYYFYSPSLPTGVKSTPLDEKRLDTFLTGGFSARYRLAPRWVALAELTLNGRLGGEKTQYYEYLPSGGLMMGAAYCIGKAK